MSRLICLLPNHAKTFQNYKVFSKKLVILTATHKILIYTMLILQLLRVGYIRITLLEGLPYE